MPTTEFGRYLRKLMDANGFHTDADLGRRADINASLLSKWQSGESAPTITGLRKIAPHLGVRLADLLVKADILTADELALAGKPTPPPAPLPRPVGNVMRIVTDPDIPDDDKDYLLRQVDGALEYWRRQTGRAAPREPSAAERRRDRASGGHR